MASRMYTGRYPLFPGGYRMEALSLDLRQRVWAALREGKSQAAVARQFKVSRQWVHGLIRHWQERGTLEPLPHSGGQGQTKLDEAARALLAAWIAEQNDLTLEELRERLAERGIHVSAPAIWYRLEAMNLTVKKNDARRRAGAARRAGRTKAMASGPGRNSFEKARFPG